MYRRRRQVVATSSRASFRLLRAAFALALLLSLAPPAPSASAHIANEKTEFPDIGAAPEAGDIVLLVALGVVPETPVFEPDARLTRRDLAAWAALAHRRAPGGEAPDLAALVAAGRPYLPSLSGDATLADVDRAIFDGRLRLSEEAGGAVTKAQAAAFIADHLGPAELRSFGVAPGPTGPVAEVRTETTPDGEASYTLVLAGRPYPVYEHARVVGPTDLTLWEGGTVVRSYLQAGSEGGAIVFAELGPPPSEGASEAGPGSRPPEGSSADEGRAAGATGSSPLPWLLALAGLLAVLAALVLARRPR